MEAAAVRNFNDAWPCSQRAKFLAREVSRRALDSCDYLVEKASEILDAPQAQLKQRFTEVRKSLYSKPEFRASSALHAAHDELLTALSIGDLNQVRQSLLCLSRIDFLSDGLNLGVFGNSGHADHDRLISRVIVRDYEVAYGQELSLTEPSARRADLALDSLKFAVDVLTAVDPDTYAEMEATVDRVALFSSSGGVAGSCFRTLGFVYLDVLDHARTWTKYYGDLVHEAAHNHLYEISALEELVTDYTNLYRTPLRNEPRPLYMAFHQAFVLARTHRSIKLLLDDDRYGPIARPIYSTYDLANVESEFNQAYSVLAMNRSKLTQFGQELASSTANLVFCN